MRRRRWSNSQQALFLKSMGTLLEKGYSISESLTLLSLLDNRQLNFPIDSIRRDLVKGIPLFEALEHQRVPPDILGYLFFASEQGHLSFGLLVGSSILQKREDLKKSFLQSIRYPTVLLVTLTVMMFLMLKFLFPQFSKLFQSVDLSLPFFTRFLITFLEFIPILMYLTLIFNLVFFLVYHFRFKHRNTHDKVSFWLRFPFLGEGLKTVLTQYFSFQLGHLLKGGLSISHAFQLFEQQSYSRLLQEESALFMADLRGGKSLSETLKAKPYFLPGLAQVTFLGQSNGRLGEELILYSEMLLENAENRLMRLMALLQPVLFGIIGTIVLALFLSVMIPVFQLFQSL
ncbi:competence type IV pilus assembly protein ComGB [Pseudalkalibacillus salsuginis]|uniref:competence type IV pilus assembly protein ComGB n=1 Tax=Pseudalkalibacillus salsuginis TaxID=2910972 RepID=UPI001F33B18A|nr:competence type IV pilus assembly protein ComGB [Pseudalkalibacillus salsuginis]MCF6408451.1 type II secretion system F family protein [Pseudalkalibacillus salsuginis]